MPEYISREAVLAHKWEVRVCDQNDPDPVSEVVSVSSILRIPAADVVEVVRCKDCKYRDDDDFCTGRGYPNGAVPDDGFCDKGERRDDVGKPDSDNF